MQCVLSRTRISLAIVDTLFLILCFLDSFLRESILLIYIWFTDSVQFAGEHIAIYLITTFPCLSFIYLNGGTPLAKLEHYLQLWIILHVLLYILNYSKDPSSTFGIIIFGEVNRKCMFNSHIFKERKVELYYLLYVCYQPWGQTFPLDTFETKWTLSWEKKAGEPAAMRWSSAETLSTIPYLTFRSMVPS